jgi:hypothetical protein
MSSFWGRRFAKPGKWFEAQITVVIAERFFGSLIRLVLLLCARRRRARRERNDCESEDVTGDVHKSVLPSR